MSSMNDAEKWFLEALNANDPLVRRNDVYEIIDKPDALHLLDLLPTVTTFGEYARLKEADRIRQRRITEMENEHRYTVDRLTKRIKELEDSIAAPDDNYLWFTPEMVWAILNRFVCDGKDRRKVDPDWVEETGSSCWRDAKEAFPFLRGGKNDEAGNNENTDD